MVNSENNNRIIQASNNIRDAFLHFQREKEVINNKYNNTIKNIFKKYDKKYDELLNIEVIKEVLYDNKIQI